MIKKFSEYKGSKVDPIKEDNNVVETPMEQKSETQEEKEDSQPIDHSKMGQKSKNGKVEFYGKVAKFPKNVEAKKANNFLENIRVKKSKLWYLMVEKQTSESETELQTIKYNKHAGVNLNKFLEDLKTYYITKYPNSKGCFESLKVEGDDKYSKITNIPINQEINGKKLVSIITADLVKLLSK